MLKNRQELVQFCKMYGCVDIDQTKLSQEEQICIMQNATHLITETGSSLIHLLWANPNIKSIAIHYTYIYFNTCASNVPESDKYLKIISKNAFSDITSTKNTTFVYDDFQYIKTNKPTRDVNNMRFLNFDDLKCAIEKNEDNI